MFLTCNVTSNSCKQTKQKIEENLEKNQRNPRNSANSGNYPQALAAGIVCRVSPLPSVLDSVPSCPAGIFLIVVLVNYNPRG